MEDVANQILTIRDTLDSRGISGLTPDELSRAMSRLAVLSINLGSEVARLELVYDDLHLARKSAHAQTVKSLRGTLGVGAASSQADLEIQEDAGMENRAKYEFKQMKNLYHDTDRLVSVLQSHLRRLGREYDPGSSTQA